MIEGNICIDKNREKNSWKKIVIKKYQYVPYMNKMIIIIINMFHVCTKWLS